MDNRHRCLVLLAILPLIGCSFGYDASPPPKGAAAPKAAPQAPAAPTQSSSPQSGPASSRPPAPAATTPSGLGLPIRLSAGTALAQTLPDGTAMGFSVNYQFSAGQPEPNAQYFWVIERAQGAPLRQRAQLKSQGTLQGFTDFRPEHGPFQAHLEDARGNRLSANETLR